MAKSTTMIPQSKKKPGPAATGKGTPVMTRLQPDLLDKLDAYRAQFSPEPSRPEAIRRLLAKALA